MAFKGERWLAFVCYAIIDLYSIDFATSCFPSPKISKTSLRNFLFQGVDVLFICCYSQLIAHRVSILKTNACGVIVAGVVDTFS